METRAALASYDAATSDMRICCGHQGGPAMREALAVMLGVAADKVRVHMVDVGGAFGARTAPYAEHPLLLWIARRLGRPIKWVSSRAEDFLTDNHGRAIRVSGELALDKDGRFLALRTNWLCDTGAYLSQAGVLTNSMNGLTMGAGAYRVDTSMAAIARSMTNTAPTNAFRGAGRPEAALIVERLVDKAAATLKIDPWELGGATSSPRTEMPYKTPPAAIFDSGIPRPDRSGGAEFRLARLSRAARCGGAARQAARHRLRRLHRAFGRRRRAQGQGGGALRRQRADQLYNAAGPSGQGYETIFPEWSATMARPRSRARSIVGPAIPMALS